MEDKIKYWILVKYGIDLLDENVEQVLENIESQKHYSIHDMAQDLYKKVYDEIRTFNNNKVVDDVHKDYEYDDVVDISLDTFNNRCGVTHLSLETIYIVASEIEMEEYANAIYSKIEHKCCGELNEKETLVATIYEIGKQHNLDFVTEINNPTYEKVKNIAAELGIENEKDTDKSKDIDDDWER